MANSKSAEKRIRQNEKRRKRNKSYKSRIKTGKGKVKELIEAGNEERAEEALYDLYGLCDRAARSGAIHKNKADRIKSRMTKKLNKLKEESG